MFKKFKLRETLFTTIGFLVLAALVFVFITSINFLVQNVKMAVEGLEISPAPAIRFNFEGLEAVGLAEEEITTINDSNLVTQ